MLKIKVREMTFLELTIIPADLHIVVLADFIESLYFAIAVPEFVWFASGYLCRVAEVD